MGRLIPTGLPNQGHSVDFEYVGEDKDKKCSWSVNVGGKLKLNHSAILGVLLRPK
jgi:hypothetical protein